MTQHLLWLSFTQRRTPTSGPRRKRRASCWPVSMRGARSANMTGTTAATTFKRHWKSAVALISVIALASTFVFAQAVSAGATPASTVRLIVQLRAGLSAASGHAAVVRNGGFLVGHGHRPPPQKREGPARRGAPPPTPPPAPPPAARARAPPPPQ